MRVGIGPLIPFLAAVFLGTLTQSGFVWFFVSDSYRHALVALFLAFPMGMIYAITRHHILRELESGSRASGSDL